MSLQLKELARSYVEVYNQKDVDMLDRILAPDYLDHDPLVPGLPSGREGERVFAQGVLAAFPDIHGTIEDVVEEGDKVVSRITWTGTHQGMFQGIPATGRTVRVAEIHLMRVDDGRISEHWTGFDMLGLLQQLGAFPADTPVEG